MSVLSTGLHCRGLLCVSEVCRSLRLGFLFPVDLGSASSLVGLDNDPHTPLTARIPTGKFGDNVCIYVYIYLSVEQSGRPG